MAENVTTITRARDAINRYKAKLQQVQLQGQRMTVLGTHALLTGAGGVGSGVLQVYYPKLGKMDSDLLAGSAFCTMALLDIGGEYSDELNAVGAGMLAVVAARETVTALNARRAAQPKK